MFPNVTAVNSPRGITSWCKGSKHTARISKCTVNDLEVVMPANGSCSLQDEICHVLAGDPKITGLLGGAKIFSCAPRGTAFPYLTFGQTVERDWSTGSEEGVEVTVTLHIWSQASKQEEAQQIIQTIQSVLKSSPITVDNGHITTLRHEFSEARHEEDSETCHGIVRYRAAL